MIYENINAKIDNNVSHFSHKRNEITSELNKETPDDLAAGKKAYRILANGDIYYPQLNEDMQQISEISDVMVKEGRKLGYNY